MSEKNKLYDDVVCQIAIRTIHEVFESDVALAVDAVVFNGWVEFIDRATGNESKACILSVQVSKEAFRSIRLSAVDPVACFRQLKGVSAAKLHGITPVAPLVRLKTQDRRFVESREVIETIVAGENLASMPWEDFEHLIRELFEKEFAHSGGEVKVTRASRDGGVDAVIFDPDPIRGGKIVVQAKRYTRTVDVGAVRDLYGTVLNEGANKGILVTTAGFGNDAWEFAKGKPLSLLDGSHLLFLLQRHGYKTRINLAEARELARSS